MKETTTHKSIFITGEGTAAEIHHMIRFDHEFKCFVCSGKIRKDGIFTAVIAPRGMGTLCLHIDCGAFLSAKLEIHHETLEKLETKKTDLSIEAGSTTSGLTVNESSHETREKGNTDG